MTLQLHLLVSPKHRLFPNSNSTNNIIKDNKKIQSTKKSKRPITFNLHPSHKMVSYYIQRKIDTLYI